MDKLENTVYTFWKQALCNFFTSNGPRALEIYLKTFYNQCFDGKCPFYSQIIDISAKCDIITVYKSVGIGYVLQKFPKKPIK